MNLGHAKIPLLVIVHEFRNEIRIIPRALLHTPDRRTKRNPRKDGIDSLAKLILIERGRRDCLGMSRGAEKQNGEEFELLHERKRVYPSWAQAFLSFILRHNQAMKTLHAGLIALCFHSWCYTAEPASPAIPLFQNDASLLKAPRYESTAIADTKDAGVRPIFFDAEPYHSRPTKVFAYLGI